MLLIGIRTISTQALNVTPLFDGGLCGIVGWSHRLINIRKKIRRPYQGRDNDIYIIHLARTTEMNLIHIGSGSVDDSFMTFES